MQRNRCRGINGSVYLGFRTVPAAELWIRAQVTRPWAELNTHPSLHLKDLSVWYHRKNHSQKASSRRRWKFSQEIAVNGRCGTGKEKKYQICEKAQWRINEQFAVEPLGLCKSQVLFYRLCFVLAWELTHHIPEKACLLINQLNK